MAISRSFVGACTVQDSGKAGIRLGVPTVEARKLEYNHPLIPKPRKEGNIS